MSIDGYNLLTSMLQFTQFLRLVDFFFALISSHIFIAKSMSINGNNAFTSKHPITKFLRLNTSLLSLPQIFHHDIFVYWWLQCFPIHAPNYQVPNGDILLTIISTHFFNAKSMSIDGYMAFTSLLPITKLLRLISSLLSSPNSSSERYLCLLINTMLSHPFS